MELRQGMITAQWWKSLFFLFSTIASSLLTSRYLQMWKIKEFDKGMAIYACLISLLFLVFFWYVLVEFSKCCSKWDCWSIFLDKQSNIIGLLLKVSNSACSVIGVLVVIISVLGLGGLPKQ